MPIADFFLPEKCFRLDKWDVITEDMFDEQGNYLQGSPAYDRQESEYMYCVMRRTYVNQMIAAVIVAIIMIILLILLKNSRVLVGVICGIVLVLLFAGYHWNKHIELKTFRGFVIDISRMMKNQGISFKEARDKIKEDEKYRIQQDIQRDQASAMRGRSGFGTGLAAGVGFGIARNIFD